MNNPRQFPGKKTKAVKNKDLAIPEVTGTLAKYLSPEYQLITPIMKFGVDARLCPSCDDVHMTLVWHDMQGLPTQIILDMDPKAVDALVAALSGPKPIELEDDV